MREMFKRAWAQILLAFVIGVSLISYKQDWRFADLIHHLGTASIVAAVVTAFWHLREVHEIIEKYVKSILVDYSYLTTLKLESLLMLRSKAAKAILEKAANNPRYKRDELEAWIDRLLYVGLLPGKATSPGIYRENYVERITIEYLTLEKALRDIGSASEGIASQEPKPIVMRVISTTKYTVVSPRIPDSKHSDYVFKYFGFGSGLTKFPPNKLLTISIGNNENNAKELTITHNEVQGQILSEAESKAFKFDEDGTCHIWLRVVEYKSPRREPFVLNTMSHLTRNLRAYINQIGQGPPQVFVGQIIATGSDKEESRESGGALLEYEGWLFEDHGYHFHWWPAPQDAENAGTHEPS